VAYDVSREEVRNKVARLLSNYGYRVQLSVFFVRGLSQREAERLLNELKKLVNPKTDRVFMYPVKGIDFFKGYPVEPTAFVVL